LPFWVSPFASKRTEGATLLLCALWDIDLILPVGDKNQVCFPGELNGRGHRFSFGLWNVAVNGDTPVGTGHSAQSTTGALIIMFHQENGPVAFAVKIIGQGKNVLWAGSDTQLTTFATLYINGNASFGHKSLLVIRDKR
jgi:hypothetical protein